MKQIALILLTVAIALGLQAVSLSALRDRRILVPAPENEAEDFLDLFRVRRHEQALSHVRSDARDTLVIDSLAVMRSRIVDRIGEFKLEGTTREWMTEDRASASGLLTGEGGRTIRITFPMEREHGLWRITDLRPLADEAH